MLSSFLDSIKGQFSKSYWLASMLPLVLFLVANSLVATRHFGSVKTFLAKADTLDQKALLYSAVIFTLLALAYLLSAVNSMLLEALEGKIGPFRWFAGFFYKSRWHALKQIDRKYEIAYTERDEISAHIPKWKDRIGAAHKTGKKKAPLSRWQQFTWRFSSAAIRMAAIRWRYRHGARIKPALLAASVHELARALSANKFRKGSAIFKAEEELLETMAYAVDRCQFEIRQLLHKRQTNFPGVRPTATDQPEGPSSNNILAPTKMGNIGRTMRSYALVRYQMDLDIFWTRLQNSLQKDAKDYYSVLQDSKVQVDCAVTLFWLSTVFTLFWTPFLIWYVKDSTTSEFLIVAIGGTVCMLGCYLLACQSYRVFADIMRSSVDLFRFQVLTSLHIALPFGSDEERTLWYRLGIVTEFDPEPFQYKHQ
jgi:hypothetical protein